MTVLAPELDELWSAVADPTCCWVLDVILAQGEATATTVAGELPITRQAVAKQLGVLDRAASSRPPAGPRCSTRYALSRSVSPLARWRRWPRNGMRACRDQADRRGRGRRPARKPKQTGIERGGSTMTRAQGRDPPGVAGGPELLTAEKEHTRSGDELARGRRELPWVLVEKEYSSTRRAGQDTARALRRPLAAARLPLHARPGVRGGVPSCSSIADGFNGLDVHLARAGRRAAAVSRAPLEKLQAYKRRMGWTFPWASSLRQRLQLRLRRIGDAEGCTEAGEYNFAPTGDDGCSRSTPGRWTRPRRAPAPSRPSSCRRGPA